MPGLRLIQVPYDSGHRERLQRSDVRLVLHIDMDVHDPALAPVNSYQPPGGPSPETVRDCIRHVAGRFRIAGASVTAFDPECDRDDKGLHAALELVRTIAAIAARQTV